MLFWRSRCFRLPYCVSDMSNAGCNYSRSPAEWFRFSRWVDQAAVRLHLRVIFTDEYCSSVKSSHIPPRPVAIASSSNLAERAILQAMPASRSFVELLLGAKDVQARNGCLCQIVIMKSATPSIQVNKRHVDAMRSARVAVSLLSRVWRPQKIVAGIANPSRKAHPGFECLDSSESRHSNKQ